MTFSYSILAFFAIIAFNDVVVPNDNPLTDTANGEDSASSASFKAFLNEWQCNLKLPNHCAMTRTSPYSGAIPVYKRVPGPRFHSALSLAAVYTFIADATGCDLRNETCDKKEFDEDGEHLRVITTKTMSSGRAHSIKVHYVNRAGDTIQAQKWYSRNGDTRLHIHIHTSETEANDRKVSFLKLRVNSTQPGIRLSSGDEEGNLVRLMEDGGTRHYRAEDSLGRIWHQTVSIYTADEDEDESDFSNSSVYDDDDDDDDEKNGLDGDVGGAEDAGMGNGGIMGGGGGGHSDMATGFAGSRIRDLFNDFFGLGDQMTVPFSSLCSSDSLSSESEDYDDDSE